MHEQTEQTKQTKIDFEKYRHCIEKDYLKFA